MTCRAPVPEAPVNEHGEPLAFEPKIGISGNGSRSQRPTADVCAHKGKTELQLGASIVAALDCSHDTRAFWGRAFKSAIREFVAKFPFHGTLLVGFFTIGQRFIFGSPDAPFVCITTGSEAEPKRRVIPSRRNVEVEQFDRVLVQRSDGLPDIAFDERRHRRPGFIFEVLPCVVANVGAPVIARESGNQVTAT